MTGIFLSYARGDDEPYARSVYERLRAEGYDVWFDRESMPARALTFLQEIRDAVRSRERLLVVLGPAAASSDYVRAEWQAALVEGKAVTPILRLGDYPLIPPELKNLHCPDVRVSRPPDDAFRELLRILRDPVPPLGALIGAVPEVPAHFQPRPDDLSGLASTILYDIEHPVVIDGPLRTTVLHGMGGVGKSVLAGAFARSTSARRVFGDGIIWVAATRTTSPLDLIRTLLFLTGVPLPPDAGIEQAVTALRSRLDGRRALIVIDNVSTAQQVTPIAQALPLVSRLLLTTRDAGVATGLGAQAQRLDVLAPEAALRHLADWIGAATSDLPEDALAVAKECGYLPLALSLQGALARDGVPWSDLLHALRNAELDFAEQQLGDYPYPHVLAALRVSVDDLRAGDAAAADRYMDLVAFYWEDGVPEAAVTRFWAHGHAAIPEHHGRKLLVTLERKALLRLEGTAPARRVRLHELMVDFVVSFGDRADASNRLVEAYRAACHVDWPDGPDDGYFLERLLDHLALLPDAGAEFRRLISLESGTGANAWFATVDAAGRVDAYRRQLERRLIDPSTTADEAARLQLLLASVAARAANTPTLLLDALITNGVWSLSRALDYARQLPLESTGEYDVDAGVRMRALVMVAQHVPESERAAVIDEAFSAALYAEDSTGGLADLARALAAVGRIADALAIARRAIRGDGRTTALAGVAVHLDGPERDAVISEALDDCAATRDIFRRAALEPLLSLLDANGIQSAIDRVVIPLANPVARSWCLRDLSGRLVDLGLVEDALALIASIPDPASRAGALASAIPRMAPDGQGEWIGDVIQTAIDIDDERWRTEIISSFQDLPPILRMVLPVFFGRWSWRPAVLSKLAPLFSGAQLAIVQKLVRETTDVQFLAEGAAAIANVLSDADRQELLADAVERTRQIKKPEERASAIAAIVPALDDAMRRALVAEALNGIEEIEPASRSEVFSALAAVLPRELGPRAIALARDFIESRKRPDVVEALVPVLGPAQLLPARSVVDMIEDRNERLLASAALAGGSSPDGHRALLRMAAAADEYVRARALALLVPSIEPDLMEEATRLLETLEDAGILAETALPVFARRAQEPERTELLRRAIRTAATLTDAERLAWAFEAFRDQLTPALLDEALAAFAHASFGDKWRAFGRARYLLVALPLLQQPRRDAVHDEIFTLIGLVPDADDRRSLLSILAEQGAPARFDELVDIIENEPDPYERAISAGFVIGRAPVPLRPRLVEAALAEIDQIQPTGSESLNERIESAMARTTAYTQDPHFALSLVSRFESDEWKRPALLEFARAKPEGMFESAVDLASTLENAGDRATVLNAFAAVAPPERREALLRDALSAALRDRSDLLDDDVLANLSALLIAMPAESVRSLWTAQRSRLSELARPQLLTKLHGLAPAILHADGAHAAAWVDAIQDAGRWWP